MLRRLIWNRRKSQFKEAFFQQHIYEMKNSVEVLGITANTMRLDNDQVAAGYMVDNRLFFKSMQSGHTTIILTNGEREATIQLFVHPSGEISVDVTPYIGNVDVVSVYYRTILADTAIAIDLKGAFKRFLVKNNLMKDEDAICEVYYQSMHPNVLKDSYAGNFVLGCHKNGEPIFNTEEYALADRIATLAFSQIVIQRQGINQVIEFRELLTFVITNYIFVNGEDVNDRFISEKDWTTVKRG